MVVKSILLFIVLLAFVVNFGRADLIENDQDEAFWRGNGKNCQKGEVAYELECRDKCPANFFTQSDFCIRNFITTPPSSAMNEAVQPTCDLDTVAMFMSWMIYTHKEWINSELNSETYPEWMPKDCGNWKIINVMHYQYRVNAHALVAINEPTKKMMVAWRGSEGDLSRFSESLSDWFVTNARFVKKNSPFGGRSEEAKIHQGFLDSYLVLSSQINAQIYGYLLNGYDIYITGHSKGAATATVHGFALAAGFTAVGQRHRLENIHMVTFASPRVGNSEFAKYFNDAYPSGKRFVTRFWHEKKRKYVTDLVPHVPPSMLGFEHVGGLRYVPCYAKCFGNPRTPEGWLPKTLVAKLTFSLPASVSCHFQEVYMTGLEAVTQRGGAGASGGW